MAKTRSIVVLMFGAAVVASLTLAVGAAGGVAAHASNGAKPPGLEFLGQAIVPTGTTFAGTTVGGLSSITYDARRGRLLQHLGRPEPDQSGAVLHAASRSFRRSPRQRRRPLRRRDDPARAGRATVCAGESRSGRADAGEERRAHRDLRGHRQSRDPGVGSAVRARRGIRQRPTGPGRVPADERRRTACARTSPSKPPPWHRTAAISSSGWRARSHRMAPPRPSAAEARRASFATTSRRGGSNGQYVYFTDPIAEPPVPATNFAVNGLVELLPFNDEFMLSMERSFSVGAPGTGNTIKLYSVAFPGADDVNGLDSLAGATREPEARAEDAPARPAHARDSARQRRGDDDRPEAAGRPPLARPRQRQQLRRKPVHAVPAVRPRMTVPGGSALGRAPAARTGGGRPAGGPSPTMSARR